MVWKRVIRTLTKERTATLLMNTGITVLMICMFLIMFVFGVTFGTIFFSGVGFFLFIWGLLNKMCKIGKYGIMAKNVRRIISFIFILWLISFLIIEGLIFINAGSDEGQRVDYLLILGAGLRGEEPSLTLLRRLNKGLEYLGKNSEVKVIVSGGQGPGETITEAEAMKRFLVQRGIDEKRIIKEEKSTSTSENILFSKEILDKIHGDKDYEIMIITSDFHLFRAKLLAREKGLISYGIPAETPFYILINYSLREYFAVVKSLIFDM